MIALPIGVNFDPAGGPVIATQEFYRVSQLPVLRLADPVTVHEHDPAVMAQGALWNRVNQIPVCVEGHLASCGDPLVSSQPWYRVSP